ncbi:hypothetical protein B0H63DRAFT_518163 [Podospora didyma]|uniref:DUF6923 domain-containing protein n=1 Tax=Podospora didyma TaxID=330526 RepID=A0AAE0U8N2_9PEZI|nr:hypothetical protein B0H63DRAFT_518163 [Podospora didyma]
MARLQVLLLAVASMAPAVPAGRCRPKTGSSIASLSATVVSSPAVVSSSALPSSVVLSSIVASSSSSVEISFSLSSSVMVVSSSTTLASSSVEPPSTSSVVVSSSTTSTTSTTTTPTATQPPLLCDPYGCLAQASSLYRVDISTGAVTLVSTNLGGETNALGYNVLDNYLYCRQNAGNGTHNVARISADGTTTPVANLGAGVMGNVGDIDTDGLYWLRTAEKAGGRLTCDLAAPPPAPTRPPLLRFKMDTKIWAVVRHYTGTPESTFGAMYGSSNGLIHAADNLGGQIWSFPAHGGAAKKVSNGSPSLQNDGARCVLSQDI